MKRLGVLGLAIAALGCAPSVSFHRFETGGPLFLGYYVQNPRWRTTPPPYKHVELGVFEATAKRDSQTRDDLIKAILRQAALNDCDAVVELPVHKVEGSRLAVRGTCVHAID